MPLPGQGGAANLQQKLFDDRLKELQDHRRRFAREAWVRRGAAYVLKAISIFGAIIVAAKLEWVDQTWLGLIIAASVGLDQLASNHARLLAIVAARYACDRLYARIAAKHSQALPSILMMRDQGQTGQAASNLSALLAKLMEELHDGQETILSAVEEADLKALNNLYVDQKK